MLSANSNYLPVLLVSVSTNAAPDDSYVSTRPRAQVDYLSHEWQEEDVWRSWRNMTRQKNEIANGIRLENASWRTWWKQRNKLKTVTPETLNWLKDSDVTWLYGPLHTASDDRPLQKLNSDGATPCATKPILKYRSITELLKSDLPTSPVFSPHESEDEHEEFSACAATDSFAPGTSLPSSNAFPKRPMLQHTKSDTHITRWGPNRAFRKDSPPRIEPPGYTQPDSYFPQVAATGPVRTSLSQDSNSSAGNSTERTTKKKHISFNTFVEQVIALDKPKRSTSFYSTGDTQWNPRRVYDDDDGYEEDQEDSGEEDVYGDGPWSHQTLRSPGIHGYPPPDDIDIEEEEDEGVIEMRSSFRNATPKKAPRSQSKASNTSSSSSVSTASSSTTNSTANSSSSPTRDPFSLSSVAAARRRTVTRRTSTGTYRPHNLVRVPSEHHMHVTIAPIAPTVLKTTEMWEEGFGDDGAGSDDGFEWRDRLWGGNDMKGKGRSRGRGRDEDGHGSDASGTPVELVYVPPFNSRYTYSYGGDFEEEQEEDDEDDIDEDYAAGIVHSRGTPSDVYLHRETAAGSVGFEDYEASEHHHHPAGDLVQPASISGIPIPMPPSVPEAQVQQNPDRLAPTASSIPKLVVMGQADSKMIPSVQEEDENDFFDGDPDYGNEYMQQSLSRGSLRPQSVDVGRSASSSSLQSTGSRGRSASRTSNGPPSSLESSTSPFGGLSPDATGTRYTSAAAYVGGGRMERGSGGGSGSGSGDRGRQGRDGGRDGERRGRDRTTDKRLSASVSSSPEPPRAVRRESSSATDATSTSSSSMTVVPEEQEPEPSGRRTMTEEDFQREAEDFLRRTHPTPSNSPVIKMRAPPPSHRHHSSLEGTPTPSSIAAASRRDSGMETPTKYNGSALFAGSTNANLSTPTQQKARPPPTLVPPAANPLLPSTSDYTAVGNPSPTSSGGVKSPQLMTSTAGMATQNGVANGGAVNSPSPASDGSIMEKAQEMVSHAGAFFGLWNH
ncbi:hypothetical protein DFP72DRAFT_1002698 [Ephemerocybe angulata]|uniref:Nitrogen regulatory protein areA GATA-like domain-containing protein n=1 Tax=Ephemerocybe angulata TaxID=980116 RepID=A0A8H6MF59_9AGAR|nr:hypothetical protein DFP72DRAFT_1002698 [Tulosesus angulatus]